MSLANPIAEAQSGYFWRRFFALAIDYLIATAVVGACGLFLFGPTDGRIRVADVGIKQQTCSTADIDVTAWRLPEGFKPTHTAFCTSSFLWWPHDHKILFQQVTRSDSGLTYTYTLHTPANSKGEPVDAFYLDYFTFFLFAAYVWLLEWRRGASLGKALVRLRVRSLEDTEGRLTGVQAAQRLVRFAPVIPLAFAAWIPSYGGWISLPLLAALAISVAVLGDFIIAVRRGQRPWHDRWANTAVIRGRDQGIPAGAPTPA